MQTMADLSNVPVQRPSCVETTALGAAYLAGLAVGYWKSTDDVLQNWSVDRTFTPNITRRSAKSGSRAGTRPSACATTGPKTKRTSDMDRAEDGRLRFFSELSEHQISADEFFNVVLLDSLARNFGLQNVLISYFDPQGNFLSWTTATGCWPIARNTLTAAASRPTWCARRCTGRPCRIN